ARQAGSARHGLRHVEEIGGDVAVGKDELALCRKRPEPRAGLDRELIKREMPGAKGKRFAKLGLPIRKRLSGARIDEIEARAGKGGLRGRNRPPRFLAAVRAPKKGKNLRVKALNAY